MIWGAFTVYVFAIVSYVLQLVLRFFPSFLPIHPSICMCVQNFVEKNWPEAVPGVYFGRIITQVPKLILQPDLTLPGYLSKVQTFLLIFSISEAAPGTYFGGASPNGVYLYGIHWDEIGLFTTCHHPRSLPPFSAS